MRSFNGAKIGDGGARGPITKRLTDAYIAEVGCDFVCGRRAGGLSKFSSYSR